MKEDTDINFGCDLDVWVRRGIDYGKQLCPEKWPRTEIEEAAFAMGYKMEIGEPLKTVRLNEKQSGCPENVSLHPANWM